MYTFWAPLDQEFLAVIAKTAQLEGIEYISPFWSTYFFGYVKYDQTTAGMSYGDLRSLDNRIAIQNLKVDNFTSTGKFYGSLATGTSPPKTTTHSVQNSSTSNPTNRIGISGFPIESIVIGVVVGFSVTIVLRRRHSAE